jgi:hypothetical protein
MFVRQREGYSLDARDSFKDQTNRSDFVADFEDEDVDALDRMLNRIIRNILED